MAKPGTDTVSTNVHPVRKSRRKTSPQNVTFTRKITILLLLVTTNNYTTNLSILLVRTVFTNFVFNFRSMIGPTLEQFSLTEHQILNRPDYIERHVMHLMQVAVFVLYSIHIRDEQWLSYFKILSKHECDVLWMWSETELKELQDEKLVKKAFKWKEMVSMLAANLTPKLNSFGLFAGKDLDPDTLVRFQ